MGHSIICEYLAAWEECGVAPEPQAFGFGGLYEMLVECQDTMLKLGTAVNDGKLYVAEVLAALKRANAAIIADDIRIAELEAQINEYDDVVELAPGIISGLEMENWKLKFQVDGQAKHIAELESALRLETALQENEKDKRIAELEAQLGKLQEASAGSVIELFHPDGCLCDICDNRLEEDK